MKLFGKIAKYYDLFFGANMADEARVVDSIVKRLKVKGKALLDVGCSTGSHLVAFKELGYIVSGLDSSDEMISLAKKKVKADFYKADMLRMNLKKEFDVVTVLSRALLFVDNKKELRALIRRIRSHLKPGGVMVMDVDLHEGNFDIDLSATKQFNHGKTQASIVEEYDLRDDKVLWCVNLSVKEGTKLTRLIDDQDFLLINIRSLLKLMREEGFKVSVYDMKGRKTASYKNGVIIAGKAYK